MATAGEEIAPIELQLPDVGDDEVSVASSCVDDDEEDDDEDEEDGDDEDEGNGSQSEECPLMRVSNALKAVTPPGSFFTSGVRSIYPQPGIVVDGFGELPLPLIDMVAQALIQKCHLAPFGHGEKTIVDTQVRNTWELSSDQFRIQNTAWQTMIDEMVRACYIPMGIRSTMRVEAKLYKLLVYESGGKFDRHQDSEKEEGMFGTLVVVLPCRFEGGQLTVHDPCTAGGDLCATATAAMPTTSTTSTDGTSQDAKSFTWDAGAMDPLVVKYAAFYGDCPHEIKPVTLGYRLCLTYNLVCKDAPHAELSYTATLPLYESLKSTLCDYFRVESEQGNKKRQRTDGDGGFQAPLDLSDPTSHRQTKLVYVMDHKYTKSGLAFKYLKNKDALVAASLARFCVESEGAFELFLAKIKYTFEWNGDEGSYYRKSDRKDARSRLELRQPWLAYPTRGATETGPNLLHDATKCCDVETEVIPHGYFDQGIAFDGRVEQEYTGNEGASLEKWYKSAALVLLPLAAKWSMRFEAFQYPQKEISLKELWVPMVETRPQFACVVASVFAQEAREWSITGEEADTVLEAIRRLGSIQALQDILIGCSRMEIQPKLRETVVGFSWDAVVSMVKAVSSQWQDSSFGSVDTMRLVLSLLEGTDDVGQISTLFQVVKPIPDAGAVATRKGEVAMHDDATPPAEFARLLKLAMRVSEAVLQELTSQGSSVAQVLVVIPALRSLYDEGHQPAVIAALQEARNRLEQLLPEVRQFAYRIPRWDCPDARWYRSPPCNICPKIGGMIMSTSESMTIAKKNFDDHFKGGFNKSNGLDYKPSPTDPSVVVIFKTIESDLYKAAVKELAQLEDVLARGWVQVKTGQVLLTPAQ